MSLIESEFVTGLLAEPQLFPAVNNVKSHMLTDPHMKLIMRVIEKNNGTITPAIIHTDLMATGEGVRLLEGLAESYGIEGDTKGAVDQLFSLGALAPSPETLVERLLDDALLRSVQHAWSSTKREGYTTTADWAQAVQNKVTTSMSTIGSSLGGNALLSGLDEMEEKWDFRIKNPGKLTGIRLGMGSHDDRTGGLEDGDVLVLAGHSNEGKSQVMIHWAVSACLTPLDTTGVPPKVAFVSLEMSKESLSRRIVQKLARVDLSDGTVDATAQKRVRDTIAKVKKLASDHQLIIVEPPGQMTLNVISRELMRLKAQENIKLVIIDYAQLIAHPGVEGRYGQLAEICKQLKSLAKQLDLAIVLGAQLSRPKEGSKNHRPSHHDVADGYDLVRAADYFHMIWTPARHMVGPTGNWMGVGVFLTGKVRNGPLIPEEYYWADWKFSTLTPVADDINTLLRNKTNQNLLNGVKDKAESK